MTGLEIIAAERQRQVEVEGWSESHDDGHIGEQLAIAAACYALPSHLRENSREPDFIDQHWPWTYSWWKPTPQDRVHELAKAGALIASEIDRLHRETIQKTTTDN